MASASPLPSTGEVFLDVRGGHRALRVSWHREAGLVVLSLWRDGICAGTFRLALGEVPDLVDALRAGLSAAFDDARRPALPGRPGLPGMPHPHDAGDLAG
jgi:hypothetical protein